ncbi:hypothetical protein IAU60_005934 [Kwoniella sp. DSM 27419]
MSNKPSYAVVASSPTKNVPGQAGHGPAEGSSGSRQDAPPPYSAPHHPTQPHQTLLPPQTQSYQGQVEQGYTGQATGAGWSQPPPGVARSRALRRFWVAFFYAWAIWILVGLLIGGGISDVNNTPHRHGHWDKHGDWRDDRPIGTYGSVGGGVGAGEDHAQLSVVDSLDSEIVEQVWVRQ